MLRLDSEWYGFRTAEPTVSSADMFITQGTDLKKLKLRRHFEISIESVTQSVHWVATAFLDLRLLDQYGRGRLSNLRSEFYATCTCKAVDHAAVSSCTHLISII